jgi:putative transposase
MSGHLRIIRRAMAKLNDGMGTLKQECIRPGVLLNLEDARQVVRKYVEHYNTVRLNSAIGYITPVDKLQGRDIQIFKDRDKKLEAARQVRKELRRAVHGFMKNSGKNPPHQVPVPPKGNFERPILGAGT